jgi:hypothetical protein
MDPGAKTQLDYGSWFWFIFVTVILAGIWYGLNAAIDVAEISKNWPKYRCSPSVMPFASVYGYNTTENFNYCLQNVFNGQVGGVTGPFFGILGTIIGSISKFLEVLNSLRVMLATVWGGMNRMIQDFTTRFKAVLANIKNTSLRMQILIQRVFASFYSVMFLGLSAVTAGQNFADTFIFKFLDTFCFDPDTPIKTQTHGSIAISDVWIGDVLEDGSRVISTYKFMAPGQWMVNLGGITVSTNHFVEHNGLLIEAGTHPDAFPIADWSGDAQRPLVCLDTDTHRILIGKYIFSDWDETSNSDEATMKLAETYLNGGSIADKERPWLYQPALDPLMKVKMSNGTVKTVETLELGDMLLTGRVVGIGKRSVKEYCLTEDGYFITPSQLVWRDGSWQRAGHLYNVIRIPESKSITLRTLVVIYSATIETASGIHYRDMCEVHTPDMEGPTRIALKTTERALNPVP